MTILVFVPFFQNANTLILRVQKAHFALWLKIHRHYPRRLSIWLFLGDFCRCARGVFFFQVIDSRWEARPPFSEAFLIVGVEKLNTKDHPALFEATLHL